MRVLQNSGVYNAYRHEMAKLTAPDASFRERVAAFLEDRYGACHWLQPVLTGDPAGFFVNADDAALQGAWAREHGLGAGTPPDQILLAQIEEHRADVFYNMDPMRYQSDFVARLPGCVKVSIAWRAAPSPNLDMSRYDRVVCNFPSILAGYEALGWKPAFLSPAHDPEMDRYAANEDRPLDVVFVGGYSRHHTRRARILEAVAGLASSGASIRFHLDRSRLTRLAESVVGLLPPLRKHRRPAAIRAIAAPPVYGRSLYAVLSQAKVVLNGAVDMAGIDRGNMRCFEAIGCGALMISDEGVYPQGMLDGATMRTYRDEHDVREVIRAALVDPASSRRIAGAGWRMLCSAYDKATQWQAFQRIVAAV
jgi:hypothetical protein